MATHLERLEKELVIAKNALEIAQRNIPCPNWGRNGHFTSCGLASCDGCYARHVVEWALIGIDPENEPHFKKRSEYAEGETL